MEKTKPGTYWIWNDEYREREDFSVATLNSDNQWKVVVNNTIKFISPYAMKLIYGKDFIKREVDFEKDRKFFTNSDEEKQDMMMNLYPYAIESQNTNDLAVIMKNNQIVMIDQRMFPSKAIEDGFYLEFKA